MSTENLPQLRIQPILARHSIEITSLRQLKNIRKTRLNISNFEVPETIYGYLRNRLFDDKPKRLIPYFKNQKFCTGLEVMDQKLACLSTFSLVEVLVHNLRKFSVFVNPKHPKLKSFVKRIGKNKCLIKIKDLTKSELRYENKKPLTHFSSPIKEMKFFPNLSLKGFSRLRTLEIPNIGSVTKEIHLPATLECIKLNGTLSEDNIKKMNKLKNLKRLDLNIVFNDSYQIAFRNLRISNLKVQLAATASTFIDPKTVESVKRFIEETNSKVIFIPRNHSHQELIDCLASLEQNFIGYGDLFQMELPFAFSSPLEVQDSVLTYYSKMGLSVQQTVFSLEIGALFGPEGLRKENWKQMLNLVMANARSNKLQKVAFSLKYDTELSNKDLLNRMIEAAASLIKPLVESKRNGTFTPNLEAHIKLDCSKCDEGLLDFLTKSLLLVEKGDFFAYKYYSRNFKIDIDYQYCSQGRKCVKCLPK